MQKPLFLSSHRSFVRLVRHSGVITYPSSFKSPYSYCYTTASSSSTSTAISSPLLSSNLHSHLGYTTSTLLNDDSLKKLSQLNSDLLKKLTSFPSSQFNKIDVKSLKSLILRSNLLNKLINFDSLNLPNSPIKSDSFNYNSLYNPLRLNFSSDLKEGYTKAGSKNLSEYESLIKNYRELNSALVKLCKCLSIQEKGIAQTLAASYFHLNFSETHNSYNNFRREFLNVFANLNGDSSDHLTNCKPPKGFENFYPKNNKKESEKQTQKSTDPDKNKPEPPLDLSRILWVSLYIGLFAIWMTNFQFIRNEITYKEFLQDYLSKGYVERIQVVNREYCRAILRSDTPSQLPFVCFKVGSIDNLEPRLEDAQANMGLSPQEFLSVQYTQEISFLNQLKSIIPYILIIVGLEFFLKRLPGRGGMSNSYDSFLKVIKAKPATAKDLKGKIKFSDVAGMKEAKLEVTEFVDFLKDPKKYEELGAKLPRGALLSGPPGGGKTLLAKAVAGEASVPFYSMSGSDFIEVFVGVGPSRVRDLFSQARKNAPSIIFIDEIDAIGRRRSRGGMASGSNDERENTLNQILVEMDGFSSSTGVVILAGTNRADVLDPALTRPGRFDRLISIERPDIDEREEIFQIHLRPIKLAPNVDPIELSRRLASLTPGFTGADIANICNEGAIQAARRNSKLGVSFDDFERASERVLGGLPKTNSLLSALQRKTVAYHETGHALVGWFSEHADPVLKVSILPRSKKILGFAQSLPDETMLYSKEALLDRIAVILGGRAAEELFIGKITTGASDDLNKVTQMSYAFVSQWGMNPEVGLVSFQKNNNDDVQFYKPYSESLAQLIDKEVKAMVDFTYEKAKKILTDNKKAVHDLADLLFNKETITYNDIVECVGPRPFSVKEELRRYISYTSSSNLVPSDKKSEIEAPPSEELKIN